jgi:hypothetical protein
VTFLIWVIGSIVLTLLFSRESWWSLIRFAILFTLGFALLLVTIAVLFSDPPSTMP